jgi:hypothetical protein
MLILTPSFNLPRKQKEATKAHFAGMRHSIGYSEPY